MITSDPKPSVAALIDCLGGSFERDFTPQPIVLESDEGDGYHRDRIEYSVGEDERVSAYLITPTEESYPGPRPAVAVWHQHNNEYGFGKSEPAGIDGDLAQHVGPRLAANGFVVLCPDALGFEDRQDPTGRLEGDAYERFLHLHYTVRGKCLAWKHIFDMHVAVDLLAEIDRVDSSRIGCFGHSMGATHAWQIGAVDPRLQCIVANACLPTYAAVEREHLHHCFPTFVPNWIQYGDTPDILALIAPRALHVSLGQKDEGSPIADACDGISHVRGVYNQLGAASAFTSLVDPDADHELSPLMWEAAIRQLCYHLRPDA